MKILSPAGRAVPVEVKLPARPAALKGLRVGLLDNTKAPVDKMMEHLDRRLRERFPGSSTFYVSKPHPSLGAEEHVIEALRKNADVVITALGD